MPNGCECATHHIVVHRTGGVSKHFTTQLEAMGNVTVRGISNHLKLFSSTPPRSAKKCKILLGFVDTV